MSNPLATIVLHYEVGGESANHDVKYEADEFLNKYTDGTEKTSFAPGDPYYFLIYHRGAVRITHVRAEAGSLSSFGTVSRPRTDTVSFPELNMTENKPVLSYVPNGGLSQDWRTSLVPTFNVGSGLNMDGADQSLHITGGAVPCTVDLTYNVTFDSWLFTPPAMSLPEGVSVDIHIFIYLEEIVT